MDFVGFNGIRVHRQGLGKHLLSLVKKICLHFRSSVKLNGVTFVL